MNRWRTVTLAGLGLCLSLCLCACSYQIMGSGRAVDVTPVGSGQSVLQISLVEQFSLYSWLDSYVRSATMDEMRLRKLGRFDSSLPADYYVEIMVPLVQTTVVSSANDVSLLLSAEIRLDLLIRDARTNELVWRSNSITTSELIQEGREQAAVREALTQAIKIALDRLQQRF